MKRLKFPIIVLTAALAVATLACSMTFDGNDNDSNNDVPTVNPTNATAVGAVTTGTPPPTITGAPTQVGTLSSGGTGSLDAGSTTSVTGSTTCTPRADWPALTVTSGMTLQTIAQAVGSTVDELVRANCLTDPDAISVGQRLFVPSAPSQTGSTASTGNTGFDGSGGGSTTSLTTCSNQWFFTFDPGMGTPLDSCPGPVVQLPAAGQNFEGGRVLRYPALPGAQDPRATIYVIYNDRSWTSFPDTWEQGQMESDSGIVPPAERYQPVQSIGKMWRDNPSVRQKLGWAYAPEESFSGRIQEPANATNVVGGPRYWYIDHGAWGVVLRLNSGGTRTWEVAGHY
ncbi:MAG: LysM domain-containing protein [Planctomycetaceae bacterium]|nr:MAG: LysM domain-containing protein [Planctomycetaceae bacterium]